MILFQLDFVMARKFHLAEDTGDTVSSLISLVDGVSVQDSLHSSMVGGVLTVLVLPLWVGPGQAYLLQLLTVPFKICFFQMHFILILAKNSCGRKFQLELSQYLELEILSPFWLVIFKGEEVSLCPGELSTWGHDESWKQWDPCSDWLNGWLETSNL